ncbi:MAG: glycosyl-4,4'-diaponeurosporenoate acyltransferase [Clostridia bacterium]|nr:glycosyl-4,4'-diaponeurosporenoate acyltransferase [Clostridia bacterium]NLV32940.1 glycosyl-4,4'-diaponeurosporenoate acyltransferase [Clostridiaceae bacterium]
MRILFLPDIWTILLCIPLWFVFHMLPALICLKIPDKYYNPKGIIYRTRKWEKKGEIYQSLFKVKKWKKYLPDGGAMFKEGYKKRNLTEYTSQSLEKFAVETCRAEMTHILAIFPFWIFGFIAPPVIVLYMLIYALAVNLPCIVTQRYNRPRILAFKDKIDNAVIG